MSLNMIMVLSQRYEILRIKPEGSQKEREAVGGRGMPGRMGASPFPWIQRHDLRINHIGRVFFVPHKNLSVCLEEDFIHQEYIRLTPAMEYMELLKI